MSKSAASRASAAKAEPRTRLDAEAVLAAAIELLEAEGYDALTMTSLAHRLHCKTSSLYNHVSGLEELRARIQIHMMRLLGQELRTAAMGRMGADGIRALALAYRDFARQHPQGYLVMTGTPLDRPGFLNATLDAQEAIGVMLRSAGVPAEQMLACQLTIFSVMHGFVELEVNQFFGELAVEDAFLLTLNGALDSILAVTV